MTQQFKKGDKVRAIRTALSWGNHYQTIPKGEVVTFDYWDRWGASEDGYSLGLSLDPGRGGIYRAEDFEAFTEQYTFDPGGEPIEFSDIKVGDTIAAFTFDQWRVSVADVVNSSSVSSKGDSAIAYVSASFTKEVRLLHRPVSLVDPEQVAAVQEVIETIPYAPLRDLGIDYDDVDFKPLAEALVKAGVTINTKEGA